MTSALARVEAQIAKQTNSAEYITVKAPGRVNLIGEHTDYNAGFVLPCAIDFSTYVAAKARADGQVQVTAIDNNNAQVQFAVHGGFTTDPDNPWSHYVRAVVQIMIDHGYPIAGADLILSGDIPQGAGLSSSASLCVAVCCAFDSLFELALQPLTMACISQEAENKYVGCQCGIMDQMASAMSCDGHASFIDCQSLELQAIRVPKELAVFIVDSGIQRGLVDTHYNQRRLDCERACSQLGIESLRTLDLETLLTHAPRLDELALRRARHVVTENQRVLQLVAAFEQCDHTALSSIMSESHRSMQQDFEITVPAIDALVHSIQRHLNHNGGARMTGGGFGGCIVILCHASYREGLESIVLPQYQNMTGYRASLYQCKPRGGVTIITPQATN